MTPDHKAALPVSVISGYLGAGKTTLINHLLQHTAGQRITVLVNDFGEISIDEQLIVNRSGDIIALANGCMCCQIGDDLFAALDRIIQLRGEMDRLLIETSGVADPKKIAQIALAEPELALSQIIVLVDGTNFLTTFDDPLLADTLARQIKNADLLLLSKSDMIDKTEHVQIMDQLAVLAPYSPVISKDAMVNLAGLLFVDSVPRILEKVIEKETPSSVTSGHTHHTEAFASWSWRGWPERRPERWEVEAFVQRTDLGIYRLKGLVRLADATVLLIQKVGVTVYCTPLLSYPEGPSYLTAIGTPPAFPVQTIEKAWQKLLSVN